MADVSMRASSYNKLKKILIDVNTHTATPLTLAEATVYLENAKTCFDKLERHHDAIIAVCADEAAIEFQDNMLGPMTDCYNEIKVKLANIKEELNRANPAATTASSSSSTPATTNIKLPAIELPTFSGSYDTWTSFMDLFTATIDSNKDLTDAQKLQYLKSSLRDEPASLIRSLQVTNANYKNAWDLLHSRYNNQREIVQALLKRLFWSKPITSESAIELQKLLDNTLECIRALQVLKSPVEHWDQILVFSIVNKLDNNTRREWAVRLTGTTIPTFKQLTEFLENHIRGLLATGASIQKKKQVSSHHSAPDNQCRICNGVHHLHQCEEFLSKTPSERSNLIKQNRKCYNCLRSDHGVKNCSSKSRCRKCNNKHHTLLHVDRKTEAQPNNHQQQPPPPPVSGTTVSSLHANTQADTQVLLSTAVVKIRTRTAGDRYCRVLLDSGSEGTFITEECVRSLGLKRHPSTIHVKGVSSTSIGTTKGLVNCTLQSRLNNAQCQITAHILPRVTGTLPREACSPDWPHLLGLELADPKYNEPGPVDILLGADYCATVLLEGKRRGPLNTPVAQESIFGWVLAGRVSIPSFITSHHVELEVDKVLRRFWEIEEPPHSKQMTIEEKKCEEIYVNNIHRDSEGRYIVPIPFNGKEKDLGLSRFAAVRRLEQVERRLKRIPEHKQHYQDFMDEYLSLGHMEKIPEVEAKEETGKTYYLPHHFVLNSSSSTTKFRVVFDGSATTSSGLSLNDTMLVGATVQDDLYTLLLRFRTHIVVIKGDIAKMFRQFRLEKEDADFHRILWRHSPENPIAEYRLLTVTYGTACAPFLATRSVEQLAEDTTESHPAASKVLKNDVYVDDVISGTTTTEKGIQLVRELQDATASAKLELRKWSSNDKDVLATIPEHLRETDPMSFDKEQSIKALGVQWNPTDDNFSFSKFDIGKNTNLSKRMLLSELARVFDPLGFLSAVTIRAKLIMQELWRLSVTWDELLPEDFQSQWKDYCSDLDNIRHITIPRCVTTPDAQNYELHGFSDASERAYGGIIYLRSTAANGTITVSFVTSKTKVSPLKQQTLARLELCGAQLLSNLLVSVKRALNLPCDVFAWCDSTIVLRWIAAHPRRWKTFIANRVSQIQQNVPIEAWRHVPGIENPADIASRGCTAAQLVNNDFWWKGPQWLSQPQLPFFVPAQNDEQVDMEAKQPTLQVNTTELATAILQRYSSLIKLQRVVAYALRFIFNSRIQVKKTNNQQQRRVGPLIPSELNSALLVCIKQAQMLDFSSEIKQLKSTASIGKSSKLNQLFPFLDAHGLLRVGGRLLKSQLPEDMKHQFILPAKSHFTTLLISFIHHQHLHSGFQLTWSALRSKYWIINGRDSVRHFVRKCITCRKLKKDSSQQLMGQLPASRITQSRAFLNTGIDYAGPYNLKLMKGRSNATYKAYICLFVCMSTKAVHLEAVSELSTAAFIATLRRFVSRRGFCASIFSDCGTNFVGAQRELQRIVKSQQHNEEISNSLSPNGIHWQFNAPSAPHHGGLWEAAVKSAKYHLRRVMGDNTFTFEQFQTILCQVEAVLNSRPLAPMSSDPSDLECLTPGHFLIGERMTAVPDEDVFELKENRLGLWQRQQYRVQHFWRRWRQEYLHTLQQRVKWRTEKRNLKAGEMVIIKDDLTTPGQWKLGRVIETHPGVDDNVRVVTLKTTTGTIKRPIVKLIPLFYDEKV